ncbi:hypothetical protein ACFV0X_05425, partial [Streptomyces mirabilis]
SDLDVFLAYLVVSVSRGLGVVYKITGTEVPGGTCESDLSRFFTTGRRPDEQPSDEQPSEDQSPGDQSK